MNSSVTRLIEMILGALLFGLGLIFLYTQHHTLKKLTDQISSNVIADSDIYQQYHETNTQQVPDEELYAVIMGYREYPIVIDDSTIAADNYDFDTILPLIKTGSYRESYEYNVEHEVTRVIYIYAGI